MKTDITKKWLPVALCTLLLAAGCKKEDELFPAGKDGREQPAVFMPKATCRPNATVAPSQLAYALNTLANCEITVCTATSAVVSKSVSPLADASGNEFKFVGGPVMGIGPLTQQQILDAAYNWAWANRPAGYSIRRMNFLVLTEYHYPFSYTHRIKLSVDYVACEGAGGCTPYETLVGPDALLQQLNRIQSGACIFSAPACNGAYVSTTLTAGLLNAAGGPVRVPAFDPNNAATQNQLVTLANNQAAAMKPAGYTMTDIDFFVDADGRLSISVRYMKCVGGGNT